jgi:hypothetical protein
MNTAQASKLIFENLQSLDAEGRKKFVPTLQALFPETDIPWKSWEDIESQVPLQIKYKPISRADVQILSYLPLSQM